jgi:uncharacterized RDD family membrane protein YckC
VDIKTPEYVSLQFHPAGLGSRAAAFIIDTALLTITNIIIIIALFISMNASIFNFFETDIPSYLFAAVFILIFILNWSYFFLMEYFTGGRTFGKMWLGIRVIQENGHSITLLSSLIRNLLRIIDMLPANYLIGMLMIFFHSKHKRLGDLVAGTVVIHERRGKKKKKKMTKIEKLIDKRGLSAEDLHVDDFTLKRLGSKEWQLLKTYSERVTSLGPDDRIIYTRKAADILLPKLGIDGSEKRFEDIEDMLLIIYLKMKEEWEYEL